MTTATFNIRIDGIQIVEKLLYSANVSDTDMFAFDIKNQSLVVHDKKLVVIVTNVVIRLNEDTNPIAKIISATAFEIRDFDAVVKSVEGNKHTMPIELENLLKSIAISTMRGIMFSEFRGTHLNNAVLPIITIDSFKPVPGTILESAGGKPA